MSISNAATVKQRFQVHLSTVIVLMFLASGFMWANIAPTKTYENWLVNGKASSAYLIYYSFGWPFATTPRVAHISGPAAGLIYDPNQSETYFYQYADPRQLCWMFALNAGLGVFLIGTVWFFCERLFRRGSSAKA